MDMHAIEARVRRAQSKARHARAMCDQVKSAKAHKRDERRAKAALRDAVAEDRAADSWSDYLSPA